MAVRRDYAGRSMDELGDLAMQVIERQPGLRCGAIGDHLFGDHSTLLGSAPYARIAGKVMKQLERQGRAYVQVRDGWFGWYPSVERTQSVVAKQLVKVDQ